MNQLIKDHLFLSEFSNVSTFAENLYYRLSFDLDKVSDQLSIFREAASAYFDEKEKYINANNRNDLNDVLKTEAAIKVCFGIILSTTNAISTYISGLKPRWWRKREDLIKQENIVNELNLIYNKVLTDYQDMGLLS